MSGQLSPLPIELPGGVRGWFTTRSGGASAPPWDELNLALHVGDEPRRVLANRDLLARELAAGRWVNLPQQVHGDGVVVVEPALAGTRQMVRGGARGADALVTSAAEVPIGVLVADCLPVVIADPVHRIVGVAHAGRRGLAAGVVENTLAAMAGLGAAAADCVAVVGPGVCGRCYEVPAAMRDEVAARVPQASATSSGGTPALDLPAGAVAILAAAGIGEVRSSGICTVEDDRFFSYRRDGVTGRFAAVVMLAGDE